MKINYFVHTSIFDCIKTIEEWLNPNIVIHSYTHAVDDEAHFFTFLYSYKKKSRRLTKKVD